MGKIQLDGHGKRCTGSAVNSSPPSLPICYMSLNEHLASLEHTVDKTLHNSLNVIHFEDEVCRLCLLRLESCFESKARLVGAMKLH